MFLFPSGYQRATRHEVNPSRGRNIVKIRLCLPHILSHSVLITGLSQFQLGNKWRYCLQYEAFLIERGSKNYVIRTSICENDQRDAHFSSLIFFFFIYFPDHTSQYIYLNINQLDALNFMSLFHASTCFEHMCSSSGSQNCTIQSLVSSH